MLFGSPVVGVKVTANVFSSPTAIVKSSILAEVTFSSIFSATTLYVCEIFPAESINQKYHVSLEVTLYEYSTGPFVAVTVVHSLSDVVGAIDTLLNIYPTIPVPISVAPFTIIV